jgi:hypothetical protein
MTLEVTIADLLAESAEKGRGECGKQLFPDAETSRHDELLRWEKLRGESQIRGLRSALRTMMPLIEKHPTATSDAISITDALR